MAESFVVSGYVYDSDESTLITSGTVYAENKTKGTYISTSISESGTYSLDLADLSTGYDVGDEIHIKVHAGDKFGIYRRKIASGESSWEVNLYVDMPSDIERIVEDLGEILTVKEITQTVDEYGHTSESVTIRYMTGVVSSVSADSEEVREGVLELGDIVVYVSANDAGRIYARPNNRIVYDNSEYVIFNVIKERSLVKGAKWSHYEIYAKRVK